LLTKANAAPGQRWVLFDRLRYTLRYVDDTSMDLEKEVGATGFVPSRGERKLPRDA
jgi:hypothetical protein